MSISMSGCLSRRQDGIKIDRAYPESHRSRNTDQKALHRDTLEISQFAQNREKIMEKVGHTVVRQAASLGDMRAEILKEIREEKGQYGYCDIVNACGMSYAKLYSEIENRHEKEQYYNADGTLLTKEDEIEWLDMQYGQEVEWQKSCAKIAAQGQVFQGNIPEIPTKEMEELEDAFYQARDVYRKLCREGGQAGMQPVLQDLVFGNSRMYEVLDRLGNLQEMAR